MSTQEEKLKAIADAIRAKEGSTKPIPANDFADHILALEGKSEFAVPLVVTADEGAVITATNGEISVTAAADANRRAVLLLETSGTWTVTAQLDGKERGPKTVKVADGYEAAFSFQESRLPEGYTEVEYIESTKGQYFQLPSLSVYSFNVRAKAKLLSTGVIFGFGASNIPKSGNETYGHYGVRYLIGSSKRSVLMFLNKNYTTDIPNANVEMEVNSDVLDIKADFINKELTVNGVTNAFTTAFTAPSLTVPSFLFARHYYRYISNSQQTISKPDNTVKMQLKLLQVYKSDERLYLDLVPCTNPSGVAGMYDLVQGTFYKSASTTDFIAGPVV